MKKKDKKTSTPDNKAQKQADTARDSKQVNQSRNEKNEPESDNPSDVSEAESAREKDAENDWQKRLDESNEKFLRLFSEFDNYRKRTQKERLELSKTASEDVITALLPVLDDLERAVIMETAAREASKSNENKNAPGGIELIYQKFKRILNQKGVEEIQTKGLSFDTDFHEAITQVPAPEGVEKGHIIDVIQKGYTLHGKVIRFARVVVAS